MVVKICAWFGPENAKTLQEDGTVYFWTFQEDSTPHKVTLFSSTFLELPAFLAVLTSNELNKQVYTLNWGFRFEWIVSVSKQKIDHGAGFRCEHLASVFSTQSECNGSRPGTPLGDHHSVVLAWPSAQQWDLFTAEGLRSLPVFFWQPSVSKAVLPKGLPRKWQDSGDGTIRVSGWRCEDSRLNQGYQSRLYLSRFTFYLKIHKCQDNRK